MMTLQKALTEVFQRASSMRAVAALGADLRLRSESLDADARIRALLDEVVRVIDPSLLDLAAEEQAAVVGVIRLLFRDALDLLEHPDREPGWKHEDSMLLEAQGRASRGNISVINGAAVQRPHLATALQGSGAFLDVGTGVGQMAIAAAQTWPNMRVVGIDIWKPALERARTNVTNANLDNRIELREQNIADLPDKDVYSLAWLPAPFIPEELFERALFALNNALRPGGYLVIGQYAIPDDRLSSALNRLLIVRSGGYPGRADEIAASLRACGFVDVESFSAAPAGDFVIGRRQSG